MPRSTEICHACQCITLHCTEAGAQFPKNVFLGNELNAQIYIRKQCFPQNGGCAGIVHNSFWNWSSMQPLWNWCCIRVAYNPLKWGGAWGYVQCSLKRWMCTTCWKEGCLGTVYNWSERGMHMTLWKGVAWVLYTNPFERNIPYTTHVKNTMKRDCLWEQRIWILLEQSECSKMLFTICKRSPKFKICFSDIP